MKKNQPKILIVGLALLSTQLLCAQDFNKEKLDSLFSIFDNYHRGMGSISLFQDGSEVYSNSIGFADVEKKLAADEKTQYRIGSITKMFTAVLIMHMVEEGNLGLENKLAKYYPEVPNAERITIAHLLRHRSGIFNVIAAEDYLEWQTKPISKEAMLQKISAYEPQFEPGSKADYSNANYILLTYILEDVSGTRYSDLLAERICKPCGLKRTEVGNAIESEKNEALSYFPANPWKLAMETDMSIPLGAGAVVSTPTELNQFLVCLFDGKLVKENSLTQMMKLKDNFGLGMFTIPFYEKIAYGHTGGIDGFNSNAFYFVDQGLSISYTSNGMKSPINDLMIGILSIYFGLEYELPEFSHSITLSAAELAQYEGTYSSETFPLKISISSENNLLKAQATGQPEFMLEPLGDHTFSYERAGLTMEFKPEESKMTFTQMGATYELQKE